LFCDQINQLASAGFKQFVVYDINKIICGGAVNETLVPVLDSFAAVGARVLLDVRDEIAAVMAANSSADTGGAAWADLKAVVAEVRNHDAVLAYYTCDDCCRWAVNTAGGNAPFALQLAQVRRGLATLDPFHPTAGAIQCPNAYIFGDGPGGTGSLDVVIFENYDATLPGHLGLGTFATVDPQGDAPLRRFPSEYEPLVNGLSGAGTQMIAVAATAAHPEFDTPPNSPETMRAIAWLGTVLNVD